MFHKDITVLEVTLTRGYVALVDAADAAFIGNRSWYVIIDKGGNVYARGKIKKDGKWVGELMHRAIVGARPGQVVDHINGNTLDNRRSNLRICTKSQNCQNRHKISGASKYKGVWWNKVLSKWQAAVVKNYKRHHVGVFDSEEEAARAYDKLAKELHGEFAKLNFQEDK